MIFATVGTQLPFDRLMQGVDLWAKANPEYPVFGQTSQLTSDHYHPHYFDHVPTLDPQAFSQRLDQARCIVAHAGTGSLIGALTKGKPILVMPRLAEYGEHRNDHQLATVKYFGHRPGIWVAHAIEEVPQRLDEVIHSDPMADPVAPSLDHFADDALIATLRREILAARKGEKSAGALRA